MTEPTEWEGCEICGADDPQDRHAPEDHGTYVVGVDDRRPPEDYAPDIADALLDYSRVDGPHGTFYSVPGAETATMGRLLELREDAHAYRDALRWADHVNDQDRAVTYSEILTEITDRLESILPDLGLCGGFEPDIGGFYAWRVVVSPVGEYIDWRR